jgi:hypothetical protein
MLPVALVALVFYSIGYFAYAINIVIIAPRRFPASARFRTSHRGLWAKYNPSSWWFCLIVLVYGLALNVVTVVFMTGRLQILGCTLVAVSYIWFLSTLMPFKYILNHQADILCKFGYASFVLLNSVVIVDSPVPANHMTELLIIAGVLPVVLVFFLIGWFLWKRDIARQQSLEERTALAYRLMDSLKILGSIDRHKIRAFSFELLDNDAAIIDDALDVFSYTLFGLQPVKPWKQFCGTKPYEVTVPGRLEGELLSRGLTAPYRALFRDFKSALLQAHAGLMRTSSKMTVKTRELRGFSQKEDVHAIMNTMFSGCLSGQREFTLEQLNRRMSELFEECPFTESQMEQLFQGLDLADNGINAVNNGGAHTVDMHEFAVQMSYHCEPVYPKNYDATIPLKEAEVESEAPPQATKSPCKDASVQCRDSEGVANAWMDVVSAGKMVESTAEAGSDANVQTSGKQEDTCLPFSKCSL